MVVINTTPIYKHGLCGGFGKPNSLELVWHLFAEQMVHVEITSFNFNRFEITPMVWLFISLPFSPTPPRSLYFTHQVAKGCCVLLMYCEASISKKKEVTCANSCRHTSICPILQKRKLCSAPGKSASTNQELTSKQCIYSCILDTCVSTGF